MSNTRHFSFFSSEGRKRDFEEAFGSTNEVLKSEAKGKNISSKRKIVKISKKKDEVVSSEITEFFDGPGEDFLSLFYQGSNSSQLQTTKYMGNRLLQTTTNEVAVCTGLNGLKPLDVIHKPFVGKEIQDVNTQPFKNIFSFINPRVLATVAKTAASNFKYGIKVYPNKDKADPKNSLVYHSVLLEKISMGQETDIETHHEKYKLLLKSMKEKVEKNIVFYGVSRGAATTFNALADPDCDLDYSQVKLAIFEGAYFSIEDVLEKTSSRYGRSLKQTFFSMCTQYTKEGPSPEKYIGSFPKNIPAIFISSKIDKEVPYESTKNLAIKLAEKGDNEVFLLTLNDSSHPEYMFSNKQDRDDYESVIHAGYKYCGLVHNKALAEKGRLLLEASRLTTAKTSKPEFKR